MGLTLAGPPSRNPLVPLFLSVSLRDYRGLFLHKWKPIISYQAGTNEFRAETFGLASLSGSLHTTLDNTCNGGFFL
jgi:hypothetical protein